MLECFNSLVPVKKNFFLQILIMSIRPGGERFLLPFDTASSRGDLKEVNWTETDGLDVKTILSLKNDTAKANLGLNNKNDLVFNLKEVNASSSLTEVPNVLCNLKYLTVLNLSNNSLESLPKEIGNLCNLIVLRLSGNKLHCLPKSLKFAQQLNYLDISSNEFSEVPDVLYYGMRALKVLDLSNNGISAFNDSPGCLNRLVVLKMSNNVLTQLPLWIFDNLCQLQVLYLAENPLHLDISGLSYRRSGIFDSLKFLNIENCNLSHENVQILHFFKNLNVLEIGNKTHMGKNYMGNLRSDIFKNYGGLKYLNLQNAQIASLPPDFDCLKSVQEIDLSDNLLSWLPESFCSLITLKIINLTSNQLLFLPSNIDKLVNLKQIHLGNNKLYKIPEKFFNLTNLEFIDLYNNQIENIDPNLFKQNHLKGIDLGLNCLHFDFPGCDGVEDIRELYNCKKNCFRERFASVGGRSDLQKTKPEGGVDEKSSDSHCHVSSFENESLSDLEDPPLIEEVERRTSHEDENWEEKNSSESEEDEPFDPNEVVKREQRCNPWISDFRNNFCPAHYHSRPVMKTHLRKFAPHSEKETVEDGQFDSD